MVQIGMHEATLLDFEIPRKYGLKQTIADTVGIGGIFRGLRTIPFMLDLVQRHARAVPRRVADELHQPDEHPDVGGVSRPSRSSASSGSATTCSSPRMISPAISAST